MEDRRDDWRHGVDENLASLNAGQRVWERELLVIRRLLGEFDRLLRGDTEKETDGLIARIHQQEIEINHIRAVLFKDATGRGGLLEDFKAIKEGLEERRSIRGDLVKVVVAVITSGAIGLFWHNIAAFWQRPPDPISKIQPKVRRHHVVIRQEPLEPEETQDN